MFKKLRHSIRNKWLSYVVSAVVPASLLGGLSGAVFYFFGIASSSTFFGYCVGGLAVGLSFVLSDFLDGFLYASDGLENKCD